MGIAGHFVDCGISAGAGGALGLIGHFAARAAGYLESKHALSARQAQWAHETELLKLQSQWPQPETESESAIAEAFPNVATATCTWVDAMRASVRPLLTLGLSAVLAAAYFSMSPGDSARGSAIDSLAFVTVTAIVWWFGDRAPAARR